MKRLKIVCGYYANNKGKILFIMAVFTFLLLFVILKLGEASPYLESLEIYKSAELENSLYYMPSRDLATHEGQDNTDEILKFAAAKDILSIGIAWVSREHDGEDEIDNAIFFSDAMVEVFRIQGEGRWFTDLPEAETQAEICGIVMGYWFRNVRVGDVLELDVTGTGEKKQVRVIGKCNGNSVRIPDFNSSGMDIGFDQLTALHNNSIILQQKDAARLLGRDPDSDTLGCFVRFKETATLQELAELQDFLSDNGGYRTFDEIREETIERYRYSLRSEAAIPLLLLAIALYAFVSIFVLILDRKLTEMRCYFLCGYSKRRCFLDFFLSMLFVILIPCIPSAMLVLQIPPEFTERLLLLVWGGTGSRTINRTLLPFLGGYLLICIALAIALSIQFVRKTSVIELYRRNT